MFPCVRQKGYKFLQLSYVYVILPLFLLLSLCLCRQHHYHHLTVGTPEDFTSAPKGMNVYSFVLQYIFKSYQTVGKSCFIC